MSTRSNIGIRKANGEVVATYCHWDGYLSYNGKILLENYGLEDTIELLDRASCGGIRSLGESPDASEFYSDAPENSSISLYDSLEDYNNELKDDIWIEYAYVYDETTNKWLVSYYKYANSVSYWCDFHELTKEEIEEEN